MKVGSTRTAWSFLQTVGVNTHLAWQDTAGYANASVVEKSIAYLGATHVRDGIPYTGWTLPEYQAIASTGVRFDILASGPTIDIAKDIGQAAALMQAVPGSVAAMEGANEFNTGNYSFNGASSAGNPAWAQQYGQALYSAVKGNSTLSGVQVIAASMANAGTADIQKEGNLSGFVDSSNWHTYFGNGNQPEQHNLAAAIAAAQSTAPGKPVSITETGYYTAVDAMHWGGGGVSPKVQAVLTVNALLDAFRDGVSTTYLYELMNNIANPSSSDLEDNFGLFLSDGTPKPAATAIHNLTTLLADPGATASSFQTGALSASITGLPSTGSSLTLEKSDGTFDLVVWNEPQVWDQPSRSAVTPASVPVSVGLGGTYQTVKLYDPLTGTSPTQTLSNASTVSLSLTADPVIIEIAPGTTAPAATAVPAAASTAGTTAASATAPPATAAPATIGSGSDTLALSVSEDAYQGDAQFTVSIDGTTVGGVRTATASHAAGATQDVSLTGNWGAGAHSVGISFINDAYGGTAAADRNLYVDQVTYDGHAASGAPASLLGNSTAAFTVPAAAGTTALTLHLAEDAWQGDAQYSVTVDGKALGTGGTVTASNAQGQSQAVSLQATLAAGAHDVGVSFLNDASGGTAATDRNLYVKGIDVNGTAVPGAAASLMAAGTSHFQIVVPTA